MPTLVVIDCRSGQLQRFESGGEAPRLTHIATPIRGARDLSPAIVESFRADPPADFRVDPEPPAPKSPTQGGGEGNRVVPFPGLGLK